MIINDILIYIGCGVGIAGIVTMAIMFKELMKPNDITQKEPRKDV